MTGENGLPKGWVETELRNVVSSANTGLDAIKRAPIVVEETGIKCFRIQDASQKKGFARWGNTKVDEKNYDRFKLIQGDILVARTGNTIGVNYLVKKNMNSVFNNGLIRLRVNNKIDYTFLYKIIESRLFDKYIQSIAYGTSTQPNMQINALLGFKIYLPPIPEQKAIASILTSFDDKIELLQAQNETLETIAQTIFKEWFGKYQVGDELPEGWRVYQMSELVETINGYSYKGIELVSESDEALVTLKSFDRNGGFQTRGFKPFKGNPKDTQEVFIGDLVVAHTDLTQDADVLGNPAFIFDNGGFNRMYITMDLVKVVPKHKYISTSFLYYVMKENAFKGHCIGYSNGTTVLHLSKKAIPEYQICLPENFGLINKFIEISNTTTSKISLNIETIKSLTQTRDTLLPKLMSGQLRVTEFQEQLCEVM